MLTPKRRKIGAQADRKGQRRNGGRVTVLPDVPDIRDLPYQATLRPLAPKIPVPEGLTILDQGREGACTGFGLAGVIHRLLDTHAAGRPTGETRRVSPHMLYAMAKLYDEWPGEDYDGSSLRGALRGFFNNGVCQRDLWPIGTKTFASLEAAKDARRTGLGAYYRLRPVLSDYHAALNEAGAIYVSAAVHAGWDKPKDGRIVPQKGGPLHAFAVIGYDETGFFVQNSWGPKWGNKGTAHWPYDDWAANIQDAWVLQLAVEAPDAFGLTIRSGSVKGTTSGVDVRRTRPTRSDIAGHFVHVRNGDYADTQPYWSSQEDVDATANLVATKTKHRHLLLYAHGGLNSPDAAATRTAAMTNVFMDNGIYPYAVFYDTGLVEELLDVVSGHGSDVTSRSGALLDITDRLIEASVSGIGTRLWNEMKADARVPFDEGKDGERAIRSFAAALSAATTPTSVHLVGHSTGAILLGHLMAALDRVAGGKITIETCSLMAPACSVAFYKDHYKPRIGSSVPRGKTGIKQLTVYNLPDEREQDDTVTPLYNKSLLYLVSNAFEGKREAPLLGMERFRKEIQGDRIDMVYAGTRRCASATHGGFDNDPLTMNDILGRVLKASPAREFTERDLDY